MNRSIPPLRQIRIGVTEGLGSVLLAPHLVQLMYYYPGLEIELASMPCFVNITNREADITISLDRPSADLVITRLLTRYHLTLFTSPTYPKQAPLLRDRNDLGRHQWISYISDLLFSQKLMFHHSFRRYLQVAFRSTSVVAQQQTAQAGISLAILPHFTGSCDPSLVPVLSEESIQREY